MIKFRAIPGTDIFSGTLNHDNIEFDFVFPNNARRNAVTAPLIIAEVLSLEFDIKSGRVLYVWGYGPNSSWKAGDVHKPTPTSGSVFVNLDSILADNASLPVDSSVGIPLSPLDKAELVFDKKTGWFRVGEGNTESLIQIADGIILGIEGDRLTTVLLKPILN